jgi:3-oxoacyl-[acyl-carrier protein] reductase
MGNVILITGSGSGIGRASALAAAKAGYVVVVNDISQEAGEETLSKIQKYSKESTLILANVSDVNEVQTMFERIEKAHGRLDILVNNAGNPGPFSLIVDMADKTWHKTLSVHLNGTFYCMREAGRMMLKRGFGRIINMASIAGLWGTVGSGEYAAAKAGIISLTKTGAKEFGPHNITINAIAPGMVGTPTNLELKEKGSPFIETALDGTPTGRVTSPEEIAALILFLSSPEASNINGQVIPVDGGAGIQMGMDDFMRAFLSKKSPTLNATKE